MLEQVEVMVVEAGKLDVNDVRTEVAPREFSFKAALTAQQERAVQAMSAHDLGVLVAPPGDRQDGDGLCSHRSWTPAPAQPPSSPRRSEAAFW